MGNKTVFVVVLVALVVDDASAKNKSVVVEESIYI